MQSTSLSVTFLPSDAMLVTCLSVRHKLVLEQLDELSWVLAWGLSSTCPTLYCKEIWVCPKIRVFPSGTLSQTLDLEIFAIASRSRCQQHSSSSSSMVEFVDDSCTRQSTTHGCLLQVDQL